MPPSRTARSDRNPDIDLVIRAALNGQDLETAWKDLGEPTGWANIRKHYRKALQDKVSSSAQDPSPSASSSTARGKRKAAGDAAGEASAAAAPADEAAAPRRVRKVKYPFRLTSSHASRLPSRRRRRRRGARHRSRRPRRQSPRPRPCRRSRR